MSKRKTGKRKALTRLRNTLQRNAWKLGHKVVPSKVKYDRKKGSPDVHQED